MPPRNCKIWDKTSKSGLHEFIYRIAVNVFSVEISYAINEIEKRSNNPEAYEKYISNRKRKNLYYRIYVKNYTIFYTIINDTMQVRRILYSKRNFKKMM